MFSTDSMELKSLLFTSCEEKCASESSGYDTPQRTPREANQSLERVDGGERGSFRLIQMPFHRLASTRGVSLPKAL